jgi:hypothetical protein
MTNEVFGKHMVWTEHPTTKLQLGIGYSSFKEAVHESVKLEQAGYKILKITPTTFPIFETDASRALGKSRGIVGSEAWPNGDVADACP